MSLVKHFLLNITFVLMFGTHLFAASPVDVQAALKSGTNSLLGAISRQTGASRTLHALAALKGGADVNHPQIREAISEILERCEGKNYKAGAEHIYEAGIDATLLADAAPDQFQRELTLIRDYIIGRQQDNGGWNYPTRSADKSGDTSVMQYGCLGLWAVERAGIDVDAKVWEKVLSWHVKFQNDDGGFSYFPGESIGARKGASELTMSINAVGSMHIAMINLSPDFSPLKGDGPPRQKEKKEESTEEGPKFGILETIDLDEQKEADYKGRISSASITSVKRAYGYLASRFREVNNETTDHKSYYYYSLERMASLADIEEINGKKWYDICADFLIKEQKDDGSWELSRSQFQKYDTPFAVLFLSRSTGKLLKRVTPEGTYGDGLLRGGRGLPEDFADVEYNGRTLEKKEKPTEPLDMLLASLSTGNLDVLDAQEQIVEQVQLGNREELIGQVDRLVKLVDHDDATIRQTVVWALGRTGDMKLTQHIIDRLSDTDLGVMIEARNALCWLSRKPNGFGFAEDPTEELPANATKEQRSAAIAQWHKNLVLTWGTWYLENRPFEDRGDAYEANLRKRMEVLKYGLE